MIFVGPCNPNGPQNGIIFGDEIEGAQVRAPLRGRSIYRLRAKYQHSSPNDNLPSSPYGMHNKKYHASISDAMDWFKTMTTNHYIRGVKQYGWLRFDRKLWQRNYWDNIIRDDRAYYNISEYIKNNPAKWDADRLK